LERFVQSQTVVITGIGAATPLGNDFATIAANLLRGASGVRKIEAFDVKDHPSQIAGLVNGVTCPDSLDAAWFGRREPTEQLALWCAAQALRDADLWDKRSSMRIGLVVGSAAEWSCLWEWDLLRGGQRIYLPEQEDPLCERVGATLGLTGPVLSLSAACASGNYAIAMARRWLELGWVDVCLAGAADCAVTPMTLAGFGNLRALSRRNDSPASASRPFDMERDGFVIGEGGTLFVMERAERARRRSAKIYAQVAGCGSASDAYHMVIPSPDPAPATAAMRRAIANAAIDPSEIDYVNAHATSTPVGDQAEAKILESVFGDHVKKVSVSSTKSMTGHLLTAAAAFEALACVAALERQAVPPTINLHAPDPECRLNHVPNQAQERRVKVTASNSFGFGGSNTCLVLRAA
jgi:3-oxoacyl-[acyl-carrier-protein] synthase II